MGLSGQWTVALTLTADTGTSPLTPVQHFGRGAAQTLLTATDTAHESLRLPRPSVSVPDVVLALKERASHRAHTTRFAESGTDVFNCAHRDAHTGSLSSVPCRCLTYRRYIK